MAIDNRRSMDPQQDVYRSTFEYSPDPVVVAAIDGTVLQANSAFLQQMGYVREDIGHADLSDHYEDRAEWHAWVKRLETEGMAVDSGVRMRGANGSVMECTVSSVAVHESSGIAGLQCIIRNVTEESRAGKALQLSEQRFRTLFEMDPDAHWLVDEEGRYTYLNRAAETLLGCGRHEIIGIPLEESGLLPPPLPRKRASRPNSLVLQDQTTSHTELSTTRKDGGTLTMEIRYTAIELDNLHRWLGTARDITERKNSEALLREGQSHTERMLTGMLLVIEQMTEMRDAYTAGHQRRVAKLAVAIARQMKLPEITCVSIVEMAARIHDIGKIIVPAEILSKPGRLSNVEFALIKTHPQTGYDILKRSELPSPVAEVVRQHHERLDGSGYPDGLSGDDILPEASILSVADVVEAMSSHRPYRPALGIEAALQEITAGSGTLYYPDVVDACLAAFHDNSFAFSGI